MQGLTDFFIGFADVIKSFFETLVNFFSLVGSALSGLASYLSYIPGPLVVVTVTCISIAVIMRVLGREG